MSTTTFVLDAELAERAHSLGAELGRPVAEVIDAALRVGLDELKRPASARTYRTVPRPMGLREGMDVADVQGLLARVEGEDAR